MAKNKKKSVASKQATKLVAPEQPVVSAPVIKTDFYALRDDHRDGNQKKGRRRRNQSGYMTYDDTVEDGDPRELFF